MSRIIFQLMALAAGCAVLSLTGCRTPDVQPAGKPGLIQAGIPVDIIQEPVTVKAVDAARRMIILQHANDTTKTFNVDGSVKNLDEIKTGDVVKATVKAELSIYLLEHGRLTNPDGTSRPRTINFNARIVQVDQRQRLLKLMFSHGATMTINAGTNVKLDQMAAGDDAVMRSHEIMAIEILRR